MSEKTKSVKTVVLSFLLLVAFVMSAFLFVGCGEVSLTTLSENYTAMEEKEESMRTSGVFKYASTSGYETYYYVDYGTKVNGYVLSYDDYSELATLYNSMLATANAYTDSNKEYVLALTSSDITKSVQSAINKLNSSITTYTENLSTFNTARTSLVTHFSSSSEDATGEGNLMALLQFKKKYGALVESAVDVAVCTANVIEATDFINLLEGTDLVAEDFEDLQQYISVKLLKTFCDVLLTEGANKVTFSTTAEGADKARVSTLFEDYESAYQTFLTDIATSSTSISDFGASAQESLHTTFETAYSALSNFCVEIEDFETALTGFNINSFAVSYGNNLSDYVKSNEFAEVYLQKLEQFVAYSLPNFVDYISETLQLA